MLGKRIAGGILAAAALAGTAACAAPDQPAAAASQPPTESLTPLVQQALPNVQGKTFTSVVVNLPPSARAEPHRHGDAFVYAYVLEGTVRSQLHDKPVSTFHPGETWVEQPGAHHVLTENTSSTERARLLVVFVAETGAELKVDDTHR